MTQTSKGLFLQLPEVFIETCDIPDSAQIMYIRLLHYCRFKSAGYFIGSLRKLANVVRMSKSTVQRMIQVLLKARLINLESAPDEEQIRTSMRITIDDGKMWEANQEYHDNAIVPSWDKVEKIKKPHKDKDCPDLGQNVPEKDKTSQTGTDSPNLGHFVPTSSSNFEQDSNKTLTRVNKRRKIVSDASASPPPALSSDKNKKVDPPPQKNKNATLPPVTLELETEAEITFWSLWTSRPFNKIKPVLDQKALDQVKELAPHVKTEAEIDALITYAREKLRTWNTNKGKKDIGAIRLGNLTYFLNDWCQQQAESMPANAPAAPEKKRPAPDELVYWSHRYREIRNSDYTNFFWMFEEIRYGDLEPHNQQLYLEEGPIPTTRRQKMSLWESLWKEGKRLPPNIKPPERVAS